jgi:hypothetical protein
LQRFVCYIPLAALKASKKVIKFDPWMNLDGNMALNFETLANFTPVLI